MKLTKQEMMLCRLALNAYRTENVDLAIDIDAVSEKLKVELLK